MLLIARKRPKDGTLLAVYFIGYGIGRAIIEGLRTDSLYLVGNIRVSQVLSAVLVLVGIVMLLKIRSGKLQANVHGKYSCRAKSSRQRKHRTNKKTACMAVFLFDLTFLRRMLQCTRFSNCRQRHCRRESRH